MGNPVVGIKVRPTKYNRPAWKASYGPIVARVWAPSRAHEGWAAMIGNLTSADESKLTRTTTLEGALQIFTEDREGKELAIGRALARAFITAINKELSQA